MKLRAVLGTMLALFTLSMLTSAFNIQLVRASGTIYIRADGSVEGTDKIQRDGNVYTFTDNIIYDYILDNYIVIEKDNIVIDGAGYTLKGGYYKASGRGIALTGRSNVTIKNMKISVFSYGISLSGSSNNSIFGNNITPYNNYGIYLYSCNNNTVSGNNITNNNNCAIFLEYSSYNSISRNNITGGATAGGYNWCGIRLSSSSNNSIFGNNQTNNHYGIRLEESSSNNNISGNNIKANREEGIYLYQSSNNIISANNITNNYRGITGSSNSIITGNNITNNRDYGIAIGSNNTIYHNNFINNAKQASAGGGVNNKWDNGYPSGGNYWSDYIRDDFYSGPYQNETVFDGIGDTPYVINENNQDNYPLIVPWPLKYKIYSLTVDPVFYDNTGTTLIQPSSWTIKFPSGTNRTVSSPVTYNLTQPGNYSIVSIIWKGTEVIPETTPTTSLTSDMVWSPSINCILPTSLPLSLSSSTSYVGFKVEINGNLTCNEVGLSGASILLSYSVTSGETWNDITLVNTTSDGSYSAEWMLPATGNYLVMATWSGNVTYPGTITLINLAVIPFKEQNVFSVTSNSTVSELAFNSTSRELSFTVTGPSGTTGYVNVYIAKTLIDNVADVKVYLDGNQLNYTVTSQDDSWLLHFTHSHSTHKVNINLGLAPFIPPQLITPLSLGIMGVALTVATVLLIFKIRRGTPPTILNGVFRKLKHPMVLGKARPNILVEYKMKKPICIIACFFLISILDIYLVKTLSFNKFLGFPMHILSLTAFLASLLQIILIVTVYFWTSDKKLTLFACLLYLANLEDCFFFFLDKLLVGYIPIGNLFWMPQYHIFGFWNISHQIIWSIVLLSLAILVYLVRAGETKAKSHPYTPVKISMQGI